MYDAKQKYQKTTKLSWLVDKSGWSNQAAKRVQVQIGKNVGVIPGLADKQTWATFFFL